MVPNNSKVPLARKSEKLLGGKKAREQGGKGAAEPAGRSTTLSIER